MNQETRMLLYAVNQAIIKFRGVYSAWAKRHGISYNELLVLYTIREWGYCTQKQICDSYLLPPQTINHVIIGMREDGLLTDDTAHSIGREKAFELTEKGIEYALPLLASLDAVEERAVERMGREHLLAMTRLVLEYDQVVGEATEELA